MRLQLAFVDLSSICANTPIMTLGFGGVVSLEGPSRQRLTRKPRAYSAANQAAHVSGTWQDDAVQGKPIAVHRPHLPVAGAVMGWATPAQGHFTYHFSKELSRYEQSLYKRVGRR